MTIDLYDNSMFLRNKNRTLVNILIAFFAGIFQGLILLLIKKLKG